VKGKLWVMLLAGAMAAGTAWSSGLVEWRQETEEPAKIVRQTRRPPAYAARKSDQAIAMSVFHAARLSEQRELKRGVKPSSTRKSTNKSAAASR
jgi:hypothetical protein